MGALMGTLLILAMACGHVMELHNGVPSTELSETVAAILTQNTQVVLEWRPSQEVILEVLLIPVVHHIHAAMLHNMGV